MLPFKLTPIPSHPTLLLPTCLLKAAVPYLQSRGEEARQGKKQSIN